MTRALEDRLVDYAKQLEVATGHLAADISDDHDPAFVLDTARPAGGAWRRGAGAMAAAAAVVVAGVFAVSLAADRDRVRTDPVDEPGEVQIDPLSAPGFFSRRGSPDDAVSAYLIDRLDTTADALIIQRLEPEDGQPAALIAYEWSYLEPITTSGGTVVLREGPDGWWDLVDAFSDGLSIDQMTRAEGAITVAYSGPAGADLRLLLQDIGDNVLEEQSCSTGQCSFSGDVPDIPIVVRLQLIDGDGQPVTLEERRIDPSNGPGVTTSTPESAPTTAVAP